MSVVPKSLLVYTMPTTTEKEDKKKMLIAVGYPKMGRRGVIEAVIQTLKMNPGPK